MPTCATLRRSDSVRPLAMRPSRGLNWTAGWVRLSLNATQSQLHHQQRCRSLPLSLRHSIRSSMCVTHLLHVTTFSLSLSLLMSFSPLCLRSRSLARGALRVVRLQWLLHLHRFAPVSRFLGNIVFLYLFFRHRCWQWALCQCRYCCLLFCFFFVFLFIVKPLKSEGRIFAH